MDNKITEESNDEIIEEITEESNLEGNGEITEESNLEGNGEITEEITEESNLENNIKYNDESNIKYNDEKYLYLKRNCLFPQINELVITEVIDISEVGVTVKLLEYNNIKAFVHSNELSKSGPKHKTNRNKNLTQIGKKEILLVIKVDEDKNYIDLSKKRLTDDDRKNFNNELYKRINVAKIIYLCSFNNSRETSDDNSRENTDDIVDYLNKFISTIDDDINIACDKFLKLDIDKDLIREDIYKKIQKEISKKLEEEKSDYVTYLNINCFTINGIDDIKLALSNSIIEVNEKFPNFNFNILAENIPLYSLKLYGASEKICLNILEYAINIVTNNMKKVNGCVSVVIKPVESGEYSNLMVKNIYSRINDRENKRNATYQLIN